MITQGDLERMRRMLGHTDFVEYRRIVNSEYLEQADDPNWLIYTLRSDGTRRVIKRNPVGQACIFLTPSGCQFAMDTRPLVCRLYPFHFNEFGISGVSSTCPGYLLPSGTSVIAALHMSYAEAEAWRALLYAELQQELQGATSLLVPEESLKPFLSPEILPRVYQISA